MKRIGKEFSVGLFVLVCIAGLAYLTFSTGKVDLKQEGYAIYVLFNDVAGLENKAPVMLNGLEVGKVDGISIAYDADKTQIKLKLWIDEKAKIRENPVISIKTLGLMGEKFIQITSAQGENFLPPEAVITGKPYLDLDALMEEAQAMTQEISGQVSVLLASLNSTVENNQGSVNQIVKNLEVTTQNFAEFSADVKRHPWKLIMKGKEKESKR
ncbi:MAG: MCE family protein [Candidatus Omnitrophica bacterium]|nr:MCE family protein [Candidatus Omnitrophota bacterium]